jgi:hypothetical protein
MTPLWLAAQQPARWAISTQPIVRIGDALGDDAYLFKSVSGTVWLPDGRIVVADDDLAEIRLFAADGRFLKRFGRNGPGPGEFRGIAGLWLTSKGLIAAWDPLNRRITLLSIDLGMQGVQTLRLPPEAANPDVLVGAYANDDVLIASLAWGKADAGLPAPDRIRLARFALTGEFKGLMGEKRGLWRMDRYVLAFTSVMYAALNRDTIYISDGYENHFGVIDPRGTQVRTVLAPAVKEVSADVAWKTLEVQLRERQRTLFLQYLRDNRVPREKRFPKIGGLLVDDVGLIWLKAYDPLSDAHWLKEGYASWPGRGGEWRVVQRDGKLVGTVQMPAAVRPLLIKGNRLLGVATDELGVQYVVVHAIQR